MKNSIVGVVPCAGLGTRMKPFKVWKELLNVGYQINKDFNEDILMPKVLSEYTIDNMIEGGAKDFIIVINDQKSEIVRYYNNGKIKDVNICYVCQDITSDFYGLPIAIYEAVKWAKDGTVFLGLPDTIVTPSYCFGLLHDFHLRKEADLTLGIFYTDNPLSLAPVRVNDNGVIKEVYDKPKETNLKNTWNIAIWGEKFTKLLIENVEEFTGKVENKNHEILLSDIFNLAIKKRLKVYGKIFDEGSCTDFGNINSFANYKISLEKIQMKGINEVNEKIYY